MIIISDIQWKLVVAFLYLPLSWALQTFPTRTEGSVKKHWYKVGIRRWEEGKKKKKKRRRKVPGMSFTDTDHRICIMPNLQRMR